MREWHIGEGFNSLYIFFVLLIIIWKSIQVFKKDRRNEQHFFLSYLSDISTYSLNNPSNKSLE